MSQLTISSSCPSHGLSIIESRGQNTDKKSPSFSLIEKVKSFFIRFLQTVLSIFCCRRTEAKDIAISASAPIISIKKPKAIPLPKFAPKPNVKSKDIPSTSKDISKKDDAISGGTSKFEKMPKVLVHKVTSFLDYQSVASLEKVSRTCQKYVNDKKVWKELARRDLNDTQVDSKKAYQEKVIDRRIKAWVQKRWGHLDSRNRIGYSDSCDKIVQKIKEVLKDPAYQKYPDAYLIAWQNARGPTEELRIPEDPARRFFESGKHRELFY